MATPPPDARNQMRQSGKPATLCCAVLDVVMWQQMPVQIGCHQYPQVPDSAIADYLGRAM
ncbi:hypothetical protein [uncultured Sulfitobacter sp.]|uniref:hypothetical protein n=1 Tax=uncultured Sulfitobacter sp. TaxID=191468 RepID=UPI002615B14E|nr:hypothetical protein [uncultured Sulfitobacter sp.]